MRSRVKLMPMITWLESRTSYHLQQSHAIKVDFNYQEAFQFKNEHDLH